MYLAEGEGVAMPCLSGELLEVHWKWDGYNAMYYFIGSVSCQPAGGRLFGLLPAGYWDTDRK